MEQTLPELQAQIDQLSHALRDALTIVESRLSEWQAIENRLEQDALTRSRELESTIEHEWQALRQMYAEPVKQLREQTATLGETCVAAANLALRGFERAETRFAALETELQERLTELSRDVHLALADLKRDAGRLAPAPAEVAPFPLEGVMRIHEELRDADGKGTAATLPRVEPPAVVEPMEPRSLRAVAPSSEPSVSLVSRMDSLEREITSGQRAAQASATRADRMRRDWRVTLGVVVVLGLILAVVGWQWQQRVNARLEDATAQVAAAQRQAASVSETATREIAATRADAERQIAAARDTALRAQIVSSVLAAPDLVRYSLAGADTTAAAFAQVLWSRSRGLVLSVSRLPAAPEGSAYQVWLLGDSAVSVGFLTPDAEGRASLAVEPPAVLPRTIAGASVTLEQAGGGAAPSRSVVLARPPQ